MTDSTLKTPVVVLPTVPERNAFKEIVNILSVEELRWYSLVDMSTLVENQLIISGIPEDTFTGLAIVIIIIHMCKVGIFQVTICSSSITQVRLHDNFIRKSNNDDYQKFKADHTENAGRLKV